LNLTFRPIAIFPTSETLTSAGRQLLERVFGCKVYDQYASSEGAPFVAECSYQNLHVELASGVIEPMDGSDEILVTSFTTHGTPLVRYRIGDRMTFRDDGVCPCGNPSPLVGTIEGRRLDFLYTASGAKINAGNVANLFKNMPNALVRAQLLQERVDEVTALLEVDAQLYRTEYDLQLQQEFRHKFGSETRLTIRHVKEIPRESSGKFRMILNNVKGADERGRE
jgi:phenylacetate-CoA ligase